MRVKVRQTIAAVILVGSPFVSFLLSERAGLFLTAGYWSGCMVRAFMTWSESERDKPVGHSLLPGVPLTIVAGAGEGAWLIAAGYGAGVLLVAVLQRFESRQLLSSRES